MNKDIVKEYGDVLHDPASITERPLKVISVGPKLDMALGGGVPEGSLFIMTGPEKVGKTVTALTFCANAQRYHNRQIYYANIEGRLKKRDLEGISDLDLDPEKIRQALDIDRRSTREMAEARYNPFRTATEFKKVLDGALR